MRTAVVVLVSALLSPFALAGESLEGTGGLDWEGDIASRLVDAADGFLDGKLAEAPARREAHWKREFRSPEAYAASVAPNRERLARIIGVRDARVPFAHPDRLGVVGRGEGVTVEIVRWPAFGDVTAEGLLLEPEGGARAQVVVVPDAGQTPEQLAGLAEGGGPPVALRLARAGCRVLVPATIGREATEWNLSAREFLSRSAFVLGRNLIGYEVGKVLAAVDWFERLEPEVPVLVTGSGEGGLVALYAAALDVRIGRAHVGGYFGPRERVWAETAERNVFGLLEQFGDAEIASLIAPRVLVVDATPAPDFEVAAGSRGKPGRIASPEASAVEAEASRARGLVAGLGVPDWLVVGGLADLIPHEDVEGWREAVDALPDAAARHARQFHEIDRHNQQLLEESPYVRAEFMKKLDPSTPETYAASAAGYREIFANEVIGRFDDALLPPNARTRRIDPPSENVTAYEVVLDVFPGLFAYGLLLVPNAIAEGERRPVVVCQHGLEGRPQDTIGEKGHGYYKAFATRLAEEGFVTFAPQNLYLFGDRFRLLQFKANALGKTLFSLMVPQHAQLVGWLGELPFVDPERIGFYGLSYGGKSAMRIPALVPGYSLSICSADFNDWVWKNASSRSPYSYVFTTEYEIFEFDLGSTFNYAEMAALIAPRPFMVERGHFDGVAPDERVALEFAKVRHLYNARLKLPGHAEIEWFDGPHTINGKGTFEFLRHHLRWPERPAADAGAP